MSAPFSYESKNGSVFGSTSSFGNMAFHSLPDTGLPEYRSPTQTGAVVPKIEYTSPTVLQQKAQDNFPKYERVPEPTVSFYARRPTNILQYGQKRKREYSADENDDEEQQRKSSELIEHFLKDPIERDSKKRRFEVPLKNGVSLPSGTVLVFDTSSLQKCEVTLLSALIDYGNLLIFPPSTISELDEQNKKEAPKEGQRIDIRKVEQLRFRSRQLRDWILENMERVHIASRDEADIVVSRSAKCNDDRILACASYFNKRFSGEARKPTFLITDDKILKLKAKGEGVDAMDWCALSSWK